MKPCLLFLGDLGGGEIMLILVVILVFFGAKRIPELARGLGTGIREFKDASREIRSEIENAGLPASAAPGSHPAAYAPASAPAPLVQLPFGGPEAARPAGPAA
ncbi:twin-arginine translocase TatA/TatE family subunit [Hymenobacter gummosus]|uniref:Sec-independent protein translocase protein TatA n=1 Tax=Hymenobacter gummosus TaxID=1776032 RepID=A0A3S0H3Z7_9BACT|nr:twin-arginine translocase TatA/TatE family subunit [Hymenobacter gummosus]